MKLARLTPLCTGLLALTGCTLGPDVMRPATPTSATWKSPTPQTTASMGTNWWTMFADETLTDLEHRALSANQDLRRAIVRVDESRATLQLNKAAKYPTVDFAPSFQRSRTSANAQQIGASDASEELERDSFGAVFNGGRELDLCGRVRRSIESSQAQAEAVEAARDAVLLNLSAEVAENYFTLRAMDAEIAILLRTVTLRQDALAVNQSRLDMGAALPADVSRAETELANGQSDLSNARRRRALFENALALLCGEAASAFSITAKPNALVPPPSIPAGLPSELLLRRPDVAEAERTAASKCAEIGVAKAAFLPTVKLTGVAGFESLELKDLFAWESRMWSFGPNITLPIFSGGKNRANLNAAEARYKQAVAAYRQTALVAFRDVEDALANVREYGEQAAAVSRAVESSRRTAAFFEQRLRGGMIGYLDVVDAHRTLLQAERSAAQNLGLRYSATVQLIRALGGGLANHHGLELRNTLQSGVSETDARAPEERRREDGRNEPGGGT